MQEEAFIDVKNIKKIGILEFVFSGRTTLLETHIFFTKEFSGVVSESNEMTPKWFDLNLDSFPFKEMWSDDQYWFPYLLKEQQFQGKFYIDGSDEATILGATLEPIS